MFGVLFVTLIIFLTPLLASKVILTISPPYFFTPVTNTITVGINICCAPQTLNIITVTVGNEPITLVKTLSLLIPRGRYVLNLVVGLSNELTNYTTIVPMIINAESPVATIIEYAQLQIGYIEGTLAINATLQVGNFTFERYIYSYTTVTKTVTETYTVYSRETLTINNTVTLVSIVTMVRTVTSVVTHILPEITTEAFTTLNVTIPTVIVVTTTIHRFSIPYVILLAPVFAVLLRRFRGLRRR